MLFTYLMIIVLIFILIKAVIDFCKIIIFGRTRKKQELPKAFDRLQGKKNSNFRSQQKKGPFVQTTITNMMTILICFSIFFIGMVLFQNMFFALLLAASGLFYPKFNSKQAIKKRNEKLILQFREAILSLASSLKAGSSLQVAFKRCENDLTRELQFQKDKPMLEELEKINSDIQLGKSMNEVLLDFKNANDIEDIHQFVDAMLMTKSRGGNLADVIETTAESISDKILIQEEIKLATTQKRMEANVLTFTPVFVLVIIMLMNPEYMEPMYNNLIGTIAMFMAALMLIANFLIGRKITNINV
ncbi:type II secretion system F family protein [Salibacterium salarium]|nr:type II secretion system F family protein [Salibacterium salarium]